MAESEKFKVEVQSTGASNELAPNMVVERVLELSEPDLQHLCESTEKSIVAGGGFGWLYPPSRGGLENYWRGVMLVPERSLFVGRVDGVVAGSTQLVRPTRNNEVRSRAATLTMNFVAPWARGHGLARALAVAVEEAAADESFQVLNLDVRETQEAAIAFFEGRGFERWGVHPRYAMIDGKWIAGFHYFKDLNKA
ncbi:GNAT family N-acetyltransferase [Alphaproteobacteria bacterium]|jgi:ribosomal protein S18 acetylase RimI-like enzyme|nr:GNAT family N-acetyltransferase [Alphaproteobacteria bacterium]